MNRLFSSIGHKIYRATSLLLILSVTQVYVLANATKSKTDAKNTATITTPGKMLFGRLEVAFNQTILVNGNSTGSGTTILSGSRLQTPAFFTARVHIGVVGRLDIAPQTDLVVTFDQRSVEVKVSAGYAVLNTDAGVEGKVIMLNGKASSSSPNVDPTALSQGALIAGAAAIATVVVVAKVISDDDSPASPPIIYEF